MLLELFLFVILNAMAFYMHFFSDFLRFDTSLLSLTVTLRGYLISIAYCLFFHLYVLSHENLRSVFFFKWRMQYMYFAVTDTSFCLNVWDI